MLPRTFFPLSEQFGLEVGQRVRWEKRAPSSAGDVAVWHGDHWETYRVWASGQGTIEMIFLALDCEAVMVITELGRTMHLIPELGDLVLPL